MKKDKNVILLITLLICSLTQFCVPKRITGVADIINNHQKELENSFNQISLKQNTCTKSGIFGFEGKCYGGNALKDFLQKALSPPDIKISTANANAKTPQVNKTMGDIYDQYVKPLFNILPKNLVPSGCLGDFKTDYLLNKKNLDSHDAKCGKFPLPASEKISGVGFSIKNIPCGGKPQKIEFCSIFDKCGTFGISISGGSIVCLAPTPATELMKAAKWMQLGYSPNRMWSHKFQFMDPKDKMKKKEVTLRSHFYMGAQIGIPECGVKFNGEDVTKIFMLKITGKLFVDFGAKNDFNPTNIAKLINDKNMSTGNKIKNLLGAAREYSFQARGSFELALAAITKNAFPDLKLADNMDLNLLMNLGKGYDGDRGSSGMQAGFHIYAQPPPLDILGTFINAGMKAFKKIMRCKNLPIPKLPTLNGVKMGFSFGERIGFRFDIGAFDFSCVIKTKGGWSISCKIGGDFWEILKNAGKWIAKKGKELFDKAAKELISFAGDTEDFVNDIGKGAKKFLTDLSGKAKETWNKAKDKVKKAKAKVKNAVEKKKKAAEKAGKAIAAAGKKAADSIKKIGSKLGGSIKKLGNDIKNFAKKIFGSIFRRRKYKKRKRNAEKKKRELEAQKRREEAAARALEAKEKQAARNTQKAEEAAADREIASAQNEEKAAEKEEKTEEANAKNVQDRLDHLDDD